MLDEGIHGIAKRIQVLAAEVRRNEREVSFLCFRHIP